MTFELESFTKVRVLDVRVLSRKDRKPDEPPGAQLLLQANLSSEVLTMFDGFLASMLYTKGTAKKQGDLDGMDGAELSKIGEHVTRLKWQYEQTGCTVEIDLGIGGPSNIKLGDVKAHRVSLSPRQGGSVVVQWSIDAPGLSDETRGRLTGLKSTDIQMSLLGPTVDDAQRELEDDKPPKTGAAKKPKGEKNSDATQAFIDAHAPAGGLMPIADEMLLRVLRRPVTRTDTDVTLLSEYARAAADRIEQLKLQLREAQRDGDERQRGAAVEASWRERQGDEYGSY